MSSAVISAGLRSPPMGVKLQPKMKNCPDTAISCHDDEHPCCIPDKGLMTLAQNWINEKPIEKFTMHGFWPADCTTGTFPPDGCGGTGRDRPSKRLAEFPKLKEAMEKHWISDFGNDNNLWDHQWNKHGTCLSTVQANCFVNIGKDNSPIRYFKTSLRQYFQFDVYEELKRSDIVPRMEPYSQAEIVNALNRWALTFQLQCIKGRLNQIFFFQLGKAQRQFIDRTFTGSHRCPQKIKYLPKGTNITAVEEADAEELKRVIEAMKKPKTIHDELR